MFSLICGHIGEARLVSIRAAKPEVVLNFKARFDQVIEHQTFPAVIRAAGKNQAVALSALVRNGETSSD